MSNSRRCWSSLKRGSKFDARDYKGRAPLHIASVQHRVDVVSTLVELGAPVQARDKDGRKARVLAVAGERARR